jgi:integrase
LPSGGRIDVRGKGPPSKAGGRLLPKLITIILREGCDRLGIGRFRLHEFRRSLIRRLFDEGGNLRSVGKALGYAKK